MTQHKPDEISTRSSTPRDRVDITMTVNGKERAGVVNSRDTLADYIRADLALTGTKLGCEHGVCGACTILVDDNPARSCLMLAAQGDGRNIRTVESLDTSGKLNAVQRAFQKHHALQCGFCTSGFLMSTMALLEGNPHPTREDIVEALSGNLCRCTGYQTIVEAVLDVAGSEDNALDAGAGTRDSNAVDTDNSEEGDR